MRELSSQTESRDLVASGVVDKAVSVWHRLQKIGLTADLRLSNRPMRSPDNAERFFEHG